ncbi:MAG: hypothetical protein CME62_06920 [Halobacteriovoraceae bacterium]|nr:hypothetical protein [Halobacteriovoraceae bacterium]|tara:strand:- start:19665 stop:20150 length:486 start_codon:yes stop_codon:yes gene_type:complete
MFGLIKILFCVYLLQLSVFASSAHIGDRYEVSEDLVLKVIDYKGVYNIIELFDRRTLKIHAGLTFDVVDKVNFCHTQNHQSKNITTCYQTLHLEAYQCSLKRSEFTYEKFMGSSTKLFFKVEDGVCKLRVEDELMGGFFTKTNKYKVDKQSKFYDYFQRID